MKPIHLNIDGIRVEAREGMTVLDAARGAGVYIPTLCAHEDLEPFGACRLCLVEVKGLRGYQTACTTRVAEGMEVKTDTPEIEKIRRVNVELLLTDHPFDCLSCPANQACELQKVAAHLGIDRIRFRKIEKSLPPDESNPFFRMDPNKCILCGRCVRTCRELQAVGAIDFIGRGYATRVGTSQNLPLKDSICESCGECLVRCPTGALAARGELPGLREVKSICPYCGVACGIVLKIRGNRIVSVAGDRESPVNRGSLCVKGRFGVGDFVSSPERLTRPLIREGGKFREAGWEEALTRIADEFSRFQGDAFAAVASAKIPNEDNYLIQKFARAVMHTNNVDHCARL